MACPAAVAQSARSVATLFRRIIVAIGPASTTDEGAALWRRNIAASASLVAAPASLVAGSARVPVEGARARAGRAAVCVCVCRPRAAAAAARARCGEGAATLAANYLGARVPSCGSPCARPPRAAVCGPAACGRCCGGAAAQASAAAALESERRLGLPRRRAAAPFAPRRFVCGLMVRCAATCLCASALPQELISRERREREPKIQDASTASN